MENNFWDTTYSFKEVPPINPYPMSRRDNKVRYPMKTPQEKSGRMKRNPTKRAENAENTRRNKNKLAQKRTSNLPTTPEPPMKTPDTKS